MEVYKKKKRVGEDGGRGGNLPRPDFQFQGKALICRFHGRKILAKGSLNEWSRFQWNMVLGYSPKFHVMPRGF